MKILPRNVSTIMKRKKDHRVIVRGTKCFRTDQNSRVEGVQQIAIAQQKCDQLGATGILNLEAALQGGVSDARLNFWTDLSRAVEDPRHRRWAHAGKTS